MNNWVSSTIIEPLKSSFLESPKGRKILFRLVVSIVFYFFIIEPWAYVGESLTTLVMESSCWVSNLFSSNKSDTYFIFQSPVYSENPQLFCKGIISNELLTNKVGIAGTCNGKPMLFFAFFFFALYPGKSIKMRFVCTVIILLLLFSMNTLRISFLLYAHAIDFELFQWMHKFILKYLYYLIFFIFSIYYVEKIV